MMLVGHVLHHVPNHVLDHVPDHVSDHTIMGLVATALHFGTLDHFFYDAHRAYEGCYPSLA